MPWDSSDAKRHTKKATSPKRQRQWAHVADDALARGLSEASAIREANAVVKKTGRTMADARPRKK